MIEKVDEMESENKMNRKVPPSNDTSHCKEYIDYKIIKFYHGLWKIYSFQIPDLRTLI